MLPATRTFCPSLLLSFASLLLFLSPCSPAAAAPSAAVSTFNVRDYGAVGDGVHDDSAAVNSALAALFDSIVSDDTTAVLLFPAGSFNCSEVITFPPLNATTPLFTLQIQGESQSSSVLLWNFGNRNFFEINKENQFGFGSIAISSMLIIFTYTGPATVAGSAIYVVSAASLSVTDVGLIGGEGITIMNVAQASFDTYSTSQVAIMLMVTSDDKHATEANIEMTHVSANISSALMGVVINTTAQNAVSLTIRNSSFDSIQNMIIVSGAIIDAAPVSLTLLSSNFTNVVSTVFEIDSPTPPAVKLLMQDCILSGGTLDANGIQATHTPASEMQLSIVNSQLANFGSGITLAADVAPGSSPSLTVTGSSFSGSVVGVNVGPSSNVSSHAWQLVLTQNRFESNVQDVMLSGVFTVEGNSCGISGGTPNALQCTNAPECVANSNAGCGMPNWPADDTGGR